MSSEPAIVLGWAIENRGTVIEFDVYEVVGYEAHELQLSVLVPNMFEECGEDIDLLYRACEKFIKPHVQAIAASVWDLVCSQLEGGRSGGPAAMSMNSVRNSYRVKLGTPNDAIVVLGWMYNHEDDSR